MSESTFRKEASEILMSLESKFDVSKLEYNGFKIWPIIRSRLGRSYESYVLGKGRKIAASQNDTREYRAELSEYFEQKLSVKPTPFKFIDIPKGKTWETENPLPYQLAPNNLECDLLFVTRSVRNYQIKEGNFISQEDYLLDLFKDDFKCLKIEPFDRHAIYRNPRWQETLHYTTPWENDEATFVSKHLPKLRSQLSEKYIWADREIVEEIFETVKDYEWASLIATDINRFENILEYIDVSAVVAENFLSRTKPKAIFGNLYNDNPTFGIMIAASKLNIPFIEIINGAMGSYHWHYTHWSNFPDEGYETFPDYIWVWDEQSKLSVEAYNKNDFHQAIVGGNPRFEHWLKNKSNVKNQHRLFLEHLKKEDFVVLVTHQYIDLMPENVLKAIINAPKTWTWLLRLHPQSLPMKQVYIDICERFELHNVIIEEASTIQLYELLENVDHLVTNFSTTAIEALAFNIDITLSGDVGAEIFSDYLNNAQIEIVKDSIQLLQRLNKSQKSLNKHSSNTIDLNIKKSTAPKKIKKEILNIFKDWEGKTGRKTTHFDSKYYGLYSFEQLNDLYQLIGNEKQPSKKAIPQPPQKFKKVLIIILKAIRLYNFIKRVKNSLHLRQI